MIDSFTITNIDLSKTIALSKNFGNPYVITTDGIVWNAVNAQHDTYNNVLGIGKEEVNTSLQERTVSITGNVCFTHTIKEMMSLYHVSTMDKVNYYRLKEIEDAKKTLSTVINPLSTLRISIGKYYIDGKADSSVKYSDKWKENNEILCKFMFSVTCFNPMFKMEDSISTVLSGTRAMFHFPLIIKPTIFGVKTSYQLVSVSNESDIDVGGIITLKAQGTVKNPKLTNVYTQEKILINKTLNQGEIIKIDTEKRIILGSTDDGTTYSNYFKYWDLLNDWLTFIIGSSIFGYSADDGTYSLLDISISLNQQFYSLEEQ